MSSNISESLFNDIFNLCNKDLYKVAYNYVKNSYEAEDIVQDSYMKLLNLDKNFNTLEEYKYYLIRIVINESINFLKSAKHNKEIIDENLIDKRIEYSKEESDLRLIVDTLKDDYKKVIILFYFDNLSIAEISNILKINEANVRKRLERARIMLKERCANYGR